jgi:hypothetical protein
VPTILTPVRSARPKSSLPAYTRSVITLRQLLRDVADGIRVLQTRDGLDLSEAQITERARNIVAGLIGNYRIESLDVTGGATAQGAGGNTDSMNADSVVR